MYKNCTTEKAAQQQRLFEATLLKAMAHLPFAEISVTALCENAGLSRKTFYRLFDSKNDTLVALIDHTLDDYTLFSGSSDSVAFFEYWIQKKSLLDALCANKKNPLLVERVMYHLYEKEKSALRHFSLPAFGSGTEQIIFYISGIMSLVMYWHQSGFKRSPREMADILEDILTVSPTKQQP